MKNKVLKGSKLLITVFLIVSVLFPLIRLFLGIDIADIKKIVSSAQFVPMIVNSLIATSIATVLSVAIAWILAWCVRRTNLKFRAIFSILFTLPMLIPSISHGMGLVLLFGDNGLITNFLGININLYGYTGIVLGSILYSFPVAFLMLETAFCYEDYTVYEAAQVLGLSKIKQFKTITIPNMKKSLISVFFAVFTMIFTDYGVPLVVGGKVLTIPVYMYREVIGLLEFSKGAIIGILLLIPAVIAFILDLKSSEGGNASTVTKGYLVVKNPLRDRLAFLLCSIFVILINLPLFAFALLSFVEQYPIDMSLSLSNILASFDLGVGGYLLNSLTISLVTSLVGLAVIYLTAFLTARSKKNFSTMFLHLISMVSLAIPGIVLGLSYVMTFNSTFIYGTLAILVLVNMVHFFASPYLVAYNSLSKFNEKLEDVADVMGIGRMRMLFDVYIPCTVPSLVEMFSYLFVNSMVTISAVSFLANFKNMPLSLIIPQFDAQSLIEATAFISILIFIINFIVKFIVYLIKRNLDKIAREEESVSC